MIFLILLVVLSYMLHRMCEEKGINPWGYLTAFITGFIIVNIGIAIAIIYIYGPNVMNDPDAPKKLAYFAPIMLVLHFAIFLLLRRKISRIPSLHDEDDDTTHTEPPSSPKEKKDFSYFR